MQLKGYGDQPMSSRPTSSSRLMAEAVTAGLAYAMTLWWLSVCALASFRPEFLASPYWPKLTGLRSDTSGALAFFVAAACLITSEYLRLRRRVHGQAAAGRRSADSAPALFAVAVAETVVVLATGLVVYISTNAITHPETLFIGATHLAPWPTEGTLRILALIGCAGSVGVLRYLLAGSSIRHPGRRPAAAPPSAAPGEGTSGRTIRTERAGDGFGALLPAINGDDRTVSRVSPAAGHPVPEE